MHIIVLPKNAETIDLDDVNLDFSVLENVEHQERTKRAELQIEFVHYSSGSHEKVPPLASSFERIDSVTKWQLKRLCSHDNDCQDFFICFSKMCHVRGLHTPAQFLLFHKKSGGLIAEYDPPDLSTLP